jgi:molybdate transport system regulatory protein
MRGRKSELEPRLRFPASTERAFGPGKAELLRHIAASGSIAQSATRMGMSYNRAWTLVRDMNRLFRRPLVQTRRGGSSRGGAALTPMGREVMTRYERMEVACRKVTRVDWGVLRRKLRSRLPKR